MTSNHFQVAERILFLINNEQVTKMINENKELAFNILLKGLLKNSKSHWNQTVQSMTLNVMKSLMEIDGNLFEEISNKIQKEEEQAAQKEKEAQSQWEILERNYKPYDDNN